MGELWKHNSVEISQSQMDKYLMIPLIWYTQQWGWGAVNGELLCNGYGDIVWEDEKVLEVDSVGRLTTMWLCLMTLNSTLKNYLEISIISTNHWTNKMAKTVWHYVYFTKIQNIIFKKRKQFSTPFSLNKTPFQRM